MHVRLLGPPEITTAEGTVPLDCSVRAHIVLVSLSLAGSAVPRSVLLERMWPADAAGAVPQARSSDNLDGYVVEARRLLAPHGSQLRANKGRGSLQLRIDPSDELEIDAVAFRRLSGSTTRTDLEQALSLVRGPLFAGTDARPFEWIQRARDHLAADCVQLARRLTRWPNARAERTVREFLDDPRGTLLDQVRAESDESPTASSLAALAGSQLALDEAAAAALVRLVLPEKRPYHNAAVLLQLADGPSSDHHTLTYQIDITAELDAVLIALTTRAAVTDLLLAECPTITDSFTCSNDVDRANLVAAIVGEDSPLTLTCLHTSRHGATRRLPVPLHTVPVHETSSILGSIDRSASADVVLVRGVLPDLPGSPPRRRLIYRVQDHGMRTDEHYAFWVADRPTFLERIRIDATAFTPEVHLHPLLGNNAHELGWRDQQCELVVNNWVFKNQGIFLTW